MQPCKPRISLFQVDGKHTLGENIADNTGMKLAIMAYRRYVADHGPEPKLINFEYLSHEQLLTIAFANVSFLALCHTSVKLATAKLQSVNITCRHMRAVTQVGFSR